MKSGKISSLFPDFLIQYTSTNTAAACADFTTSAPDSDAISPLASLGANQCSLEAVNSLPMDSGVGLN